MTNLDQAGTSSSLLNGTIVIPAQRGEMSSPIDLSGPVPVPVPGPVPVPVPVAVSGFGPAARPARPSVPDLTAIVALVCAVAGLFTCGLGGAAGVVLGHVSRSRSRRSGRPLDGMALAAIVVGWLAFAVGAGFAVLELARIGRFAAML